VAGVVKDVQGPFQLAVGDSHYAHAGTTVVDLVRQTLAHEASSNDPDTDGFSLHCPRLKGIVDENQVFPPAGDPQRTSLESFPIDDLRFIFCFNSVSN